MQALQDAADKLVRGGTNPKPCRRRFYAPLPETPAAVDIYQVKKQKEVVSIWQVSVT